MMIEAFLVLPIYVGVITLFYRFRHIIKIMSEVNEIFSDLFSENDNESTMSKREFLLEKLKNGESISNSKTPWTVDRLEKASDRVVKKLYENYQNPPPVKINKQEALDVGKPVCPVVIEMYAEGLKSIIGQLPYISGKYTINVKKLKANISENKIFCDNLAIKIGSKMIEQMGENSITRVGVSLAAMTWDAVEPVQKSEVRDSSENIACGSAMSKSNEVI